MIKNCKKRDMPLSVLLSEEEDDKLNRLVDIFGMDSRSDTIRKLIVLAYDSPNTGRQVK